MFSGWCFANLCFLLFEILKNKFKILLGKKILRLDRKSENVAIFLTPCTIYQPALFKLHPEIPFNINAAKFAINHTLYYAEIHLHGNGSFPCFRDLKSEEYIQQNFLGLNGISITRKQKLKQTFVWKIPNVSVLSFKKNKQRLLSTVFCFLQFL